VNPDLVALLALQQDDTAVSAVRDRLKESDAQVAALDKASASATAALARAKTALDAEEVRHRELTNKVQDHKALQEHHVSALDAVRKPREATAAMAQIEMTRKVLAQEESDLHGIGSRIMDLRQAVGLQELEIAEIAQKQAEERATIAEARAGIEKELAAALAKRNGTATGVSKSMLSKYERLKDRGQSEPLFALRGQACGRCNTAIPLQRRNGIAGGRAIEVCEGCGVLLYATA
jgi:predicted  nucleic acid-binding Zn-ribbon protein